MITIEPYTPQKRSEWDAFAASSRNATFLHLRPYMDYHADRFADASLIARDARGRIVGLLPACRSGRAMSSHAGLTYGGWLLPPDRVDINAMMELWEAMTGHLRADGVTELTYKPVPHIYHKYPAEEDLYALWRAGAVVTARQVSSTIDLRAPLPPRKDQRHKLALAARAGLKTGPSERWADFWAILESVLATRHGTRPVHTLAEITRLHAAMPDRIELWGAESADGRLVAGTVLYLTDTVVHSQYIASGEEGRAAGAVGAMYAAIADRYTAEGRRRWLDFGTSCEDGGRVLNAGLAEQKASFGARATIYDTYTLSI